MKNSGSIFEINSKITFYLNKGTYFILLFLFLVSPVTLIISLLLGYGLLLLIEIEKVSEQNMKYFVIILLCFGLTLEGFNIYFNHYLFYKHNFFDFFSVYFGSTFKTIFLGHKDYGILGTFRRVFCSLSRIDYEIPGSIVPNFSYFYDWFFSIPNLTFLFIDSSLFVVNKLIIPAKQKELRANAANRIEAKITPFPKYLEMKKHAAKLGQSEFNNIINFGIDQSLRVFSLEQKDVKNHALVLGCTGSGKTVSMFSFMEYAVKQNIPLIVIDGKGSRDLIDALNQCTKQYNKALKLFSLADEIKSSYNICSYNALSIGKETELKEKLLSLVMNNNSSAASDFYRNIDQGFIQFVFSLLLTLGIEIDLKVFNDTLTTKQIQQYMALVQSDSRMPLRKKEDLISQYEGFKGIINGDQLSGIKQAVNNIVFSQIGELFEAAGKDSTTVIDLYKDCVDNNEVILFSLSAGAFPHFIKTIGEMVVTDINAISSKIESSTIKSKTICLVLDEFTAIGAKAVRQTLTRNRSSGMFCILGSQSIGTIEHEDRALAQDLKANHGITIIHKQKTALDAEQLSSDIGTKESIQITAQIGENGSTGVGTSRETREFIIHPDEIKHLREGECIVYNSNHKDFKAVKVVSRYSKFIELAKR